MHTLALMAGKDKNMTKSQHTSGPWELSEHNTSLWAKSPLNARVRIANVVTHSKMNGIDHEANARLIAAAPELLAACIEATSLFDNYPQCYETIGTLEVLNSAIKATQKAKGE